MVWESVLVYPDRSTVCVVPPVINSCKSSPLKEAERVWVSVLVKELRSTVAEVVVFSGRSCRVVPAKAALMVCESVFVVASVKYKTEVVEETVNTCPELP